MISTLISNSTIKIFLSNEEMVRYNIKFDDLNKEKYETKIFILNLINEIKKINNIDLSNEKLYIEAFEQSNGSCLIYISIKGDKFKRKDKISTEIFLMLQMQARFYGNIKIIFSERVISYVPMKVIV